MMSSLILRSYLTGFFAACVIGPVFTLILYRTVTSGVAAGLASAVGMSTADGVFFFLAAISGISYGQQWFGRIRAIEIVGGPLMIFFGLWTLLKKSQLPSNTKVGGRTAFFWQTVSALLLTLANPLTILFFGAVATQIFPEMATFSLLRIILASICLSLGSFSLLTVTIIILRKQSSIEPESLIRFFKTLSGLGLLLTGSLLSFGQWASIHNWQGNNASPSNNVPISKTP